jgi:hypothetical protein
VIAVETKAVFVEGDTSIIHMNEEVTVIGVVVSVIGVLSDTVQVESRMFSVHIHGLLVIVFRIVAKGVKGAILAITLRTNHILVEVVGNRVLDHLVIDNVVSYGTPCSVTFDSLRRRLRNSWLNSSASVLFCVRRQGLESSCAVNLTEVICGILVCMVVIILDDILAIASKPTGFLIGAIS